MYSALGRFLGVKSKSGALARSEEGAVCANVSFFGAMVREEHATSSKTGTMQTNP
ncbi:hypothetical protein [Methylococcus geothermalis]|uniref:hypothetical protein n=1 Tax=Methylococcus geothermalis TaxID=2681310 RepID=UPI001E4065B3|nr:hypothetical protein [Methylococcus geothermalis]